VPDKLAERVRSSMVTEVHDTQTWYIVKRRPHCEIVSSSTSEENDQAVQERWGPFNPNLKFSRVASDHLIRKVPTDLGSKGRWGSQWEVDVDSSTLAPASSASIVPSLVGWQSSASRLQRFSVVCWCANFVALAQRDFGHPLVPPLHLGQSPPY